MNDSAEVRARAERFTERARALEEEIGRVIVGQRQVVRQVLVCLLSGGHALLEGVPGLGKTVLVRTIGRAVSLSFSRIQFTPDLMPADIVGTQVIDEGPGSGRRFRFQPGPIFAHVVLADEINRATPKTQSALLEAMQERAVTVGGETRPLPHPFFVLATQNPLEMEGTYPLPEAQLDRFLFKVLVPYPSADELMEIAARTTGATLPEAEPVLSGEELVELMALVREVPAATPVVEHAVRLVRATHPGNEEAPEAVRRFVRCGASPRGLQALLLAAKATALLEGRYNVAYDDLRAVALPALRHRLLLNFEGQAEGVAPDEVVGEVLAAVQPAVPGGRRP